MNNREMLELLFMIRKDFEMLRDGEWQPDEPSIEASIDNVDSVINQLEKNN